MRRERDDKLPDGRDRPAQPAPPENGARFTLPAPPPSGKYGSQPQASVSASAAPAPTGVATTRMGLPLPPPVTPSLPYATAPKAATPQPAAPDVALAAPPPPVLAGHQAVTTPTQPRQPPASPTKETPAVTHPTAPRSQAVSTPTAPTLPERPKPYTSSKLRAIALSKSPGEKWGMVFNRDVAPLTITTVKQGSVAHRHGVRDGDIVRTINGDPPPTDFKSAMTFFAREQLLVSLQAGPGALPGAQSVKKVAPAAAVDTTAAAVAAQPVARSLNLRVPPKSADAASTATAAQASSHATASASTPAPSGRLLEPPEGRSLLTSTAPLPSARGQVAPRGSVPSYLLVALSAFGATNPAPAGSLQHPPVHTPAAEQGSDAALLAYATKRIRADGALQQPAPAVDPALANLRTAASEASMRTLLSKLRSEVARRTEAAAAAAAQAKGEGLANVITGDSHLLQVALR